MIALIEASRLGAVMSGWSRFTPAAIADRCPTSGVETMRVFVQCPQGHRFVCDDRHLGKRVLCAHNGCGEKFRLVPVELGEAGADLPLPAVFDHGGRCAFCHSRLELGSIVCRHCGMNLKTGERLRVIYGDEDLSKHVEREPSQPWLVNPDEKIDL